MERRARCPRARAWGSVSRRWSPRPARGRTCTPPDDSAHTIHRDTRRTIPNGTSGRLAWSGQSGSMNGTSAAAVRYAAFASTEHRQPRRTAFCEPGSGSAPSSLSPTRISTDDRMPAGRGPEGARADDARPPAPTADCSVNQTQQGRSDGPPDDSAGSTHRSEIRRRKRGTRTGSDPLVRGTHVASHSPRRYLTVPSHAGRRARSTAPQRGQATALTCGSGGSEPPVTGVTSALETPQRASDQA